MKVENIIIKCATNEDIDDICKFEEEARRTEPDIWGWEFDKTEYKEKLMKLDIEELKSSKIIIAKKNDSIIGRCDITTILSLVDCEKTGYVDWIYTLINHRGNGVGKKLLEGAEEYFKSQGAESYFLFTASNEQASEFYHRQDKLKFSKKEVAERELR